MKSGLAVALSVLALASAALVPSHAGRADQSHAVVQHAVLSVAPGETLDLELQDPINTMTTRRGARVELTNTIDVIVDGRVAVPRGSTVHAIVAESKRAGRIFGKAKVRLEFKNVELPDGTHLPLSAILNRAGWWGSKGTIEQTIKGEAGKGHDVYTIGQGAAQGAIFGVIFGGGSGAARGAAAGAAASAIGVMLQRGPDLDLPPGMMFEIELSKPLEVPLRAVEATERASADTQGPKGPNLAAEDSPPVLSHGRESSEPEQASAQEPEAPEAPTVAANRTPPPAPPPPQPAAASSPEASHGGYTLKVNVNLVLVETTVRDAQGQIVDGLKQNDFRIFEDGAEQQIAYFSQDELPLAVAMVIDRSGSIAPYLDELRDAALETLSQLKPEDEVALFSFASKSERLEYLTADRERIADAISRIQPGGGTNITDALYDATVYLGRAAAHRRHAIILVSDNQGTVRGFARDKGVIHTALETETVIYSIQIGGSPGIRGLNQPIWTPGTGSVGKITRETGGEIIGVGSAESIGPAMAAIISRLKQRYTIGYQSTNQNRDGAFREIEVRLAGQYATDGNHYSIYARRGYYAPMERVAAHKSSH
jgi:Ca-activated chloride channel homolog